MANGGDLMRPMIVRGEADENGELVPVTGGSAGSYHPQAIPAGQFYVVTPYDDRITLGFGLFALALVKADGVGHLGAELAAVVLHVGAALGLAVGFRIHGDGGISHLTTGADDANGDFATICDEHFHAAAHSSYHSPP